MVTGGQGVGELVANKKKPRCRGSGAGASSGGGLGVGGQPGSQLGRALEVEQGIGQCFQLIHW
jgi:hypothetical protein